MNKSATIQARIDPRVKNKAQKILNKLNISMSEAISIFLTQVSLNKGIPFEIKIPNELTEDTLRKSENGEELHEVSDVNQLFKELNNWGYYILLSSKRISKKFRTKEKKSLYFKL